MCTNSETNQTGKRHCDKVRNLPVLERTVPKWTLPKRIFPKWTVPKWTWNPMRGTRSILFASAFFVLIAPTNHRSVLAQEEDSKQQGTASNERTTVPSVNVALDSLKGMDLGRDSLALVRLKYSNPTDGNSRRSGWATDFPAADRNLSSRIAKLTGLKVEPNGIVLEPSDPAISAHPILYLSGNGDWFVSDAEADSLRNYLLAGGFLWIDDSWGDREKANAQAQIAKILPGMPMKELDLTHPIFHRVYELNTKPKVPAIAYALQVEGRRGELEPDDHQQASYSGIHDQHGRLTVLLCHNTDLADGWERVDDHPGYAEKYSEALAFPLGINIVVHALLQQRDRKVASSSTKSKDEP